MNQSEYTVGSLSALINSSSGKKSKIKNDIFGEVTQKLVRFKVLEPEKNIAKGIVPKGSEISELDSEDDEHEVKSNRKVNYLRLQHETNNRCTLKDSEQESRTVFIGNLPISIKKKKLMKLFKKFGDIESIRLRNAAVSDVSVPKKLAVIKKDFHPSRTNISAYVRFSSEDNANRALAVHGEVIDGHHLQVNMANSTTVIDCKKAVFVGNLIFEAEEEDLWKHFSTCGDISGVRIVRDTQTGCAKGFGFVNFKTLDGVELAIQLDGQPLKGRPLRVTRCKNMPEKSARVASLPVSKSARIQETFEKKKKKKKDSSRHSAKSFVGNIAEKQNKKKKKVNKLEKRRKYISKLLCNNKTT